MSTPLRHLLALAACALTAAVAWPLHGTLDLANTVMLFLLTVVLVAAFLGRPPAILASFASVALFDFFFVPPQISFAVSDAQYLVTFAVMLAVALFISHLTAGLKSSTDEAMAREGRTRALYSLAKALAGSVEPGQVVEETVEIHRTARRRWSHVPAAGRARIAAGFPSRERNARTGVDHDRTVERERRVPQPGSHRLPGDRRLGWTVPAPPAGRLDPLSRSAAT